MKYILQLADEIVMIAILIFILFSPALCQTTQGENVVVIAPSPDMTTVVRQADYEPKLKVFTGFSQLYIVSDETIGGPTILISRDRARLNGWNGSAEYSFGEFKEIYLGAVVDISGHYGQVTNSARFTNPAPFPVTTLINSNPTHLHTFLAGPQLSRNFARSRVTVFGRGLVGASRLTGGFKQEPEYALAFGAGGGVDLNYRNGKFFVGLLRIDYLRTQFEYSNQLKTFQQGHAQQDSVRTGFGVGLRF